jgi:hypothetical protein
VDLGSDNSVDPTWRRHMVFGGTNILQHTERSEGEGVNERSVQFSSVQCSIVHYSAVHCSIVSFSTIFLSRRVLYRY